MHGKGIVILVGTIALMTECEKHHRAVTIYDYDNLRTGRACLT